jgi:hypothetical protein
MIEEIKEYKQSSMIVEKWDNHVEGDAPKASNHQ